MRTRSPDVDNRTEVGVGSLGVGDGGGTDGDGDTNTSGGGVDSIDVAVTSGDDSGNTGAYEVGDGVVDRRGGTTSQAHRNNSGTADMVAGNPVNPRDHVCIGTRASVTENLDCNNLSALGDAAVLISTSCEKGETDGRTKGRKLQFLHSGFRDRSRLGSTSDQLIAREYECGRSLTA